MLVIEDLHLIANVIMGYMIMELKIVKFVIINVRLVKEKVLV